MNRWIHAAFGVLALSLLLVLVLLWQSPERNLPDPTPTPPTTALPPPTGSPTVDPTVAPTVNPTTSPCPGQGAPVRLRVATINIHGAVGADGTYAINTMADEIGSWQADVVLLQEVHRFRLRSGLDDQPDVLARLLGMRVVFGRNFTRPSDAAGLPRRESGTAILSTRPIQSWSNQLLPNFPGLQQRGLLRATIRVGGRDIDVYNTHLQHTRGVIRIVQTRGIKRLIATPARPFLLGGDFNAEPESPAMQVLQDVTTDPWPQVGDGDGLTVPPRVPKRRIDFVLYGTGGWVPEQAQVLRSAISDHRAVLVDYVLPTPPAC